MKTIFMILLLLMFGYSGAYTVTIYGVDNCGYTTDLKTQCSKNNIQFTYRNVNETKWFNEMFSVVTEFNLAKDNYVDLPVVLIEVDGKKYGVVRPSIEKLKQLIGTTSAITIGNKIDLSGSVYTLSGIRVAFTENISSLPPGVYILKGSDKTVKFYKQ